MKPPDRQHDYTRLSAGTSAAQQSPHHGPPPGLRVDGGGRDGRRPRRSGQSGPQPDSPAVRPPTGHTDRAAPARNTPARSPHEEPRGTTASSRNAADDTARAQTPAPDRTDVKDTSEEVCDGVEHEEWMAPSARVLMLEVRRPRTLPRRLPDPHAAILFA
jgi:hypothetical protein